jgi:N-acetyl-gamma-glutamyl-phosphate reductase
MIRVAIAGASGYTGVELVKLITNHPGATLTAITSNRYKGQPFSRIFPSMRAFDHLICEALDPKTLSKRADVVFLALPHKVSMHHAPAFLEHGVKVIDLSADYRFLEPAAYESVYQEHTSKALLKQSTYGLSELFSDQIKQSDLIGNPGCYPTSILLPLLPLLGEQLISPNNIICDSKSGVSGAGRSLSLGTHFCEVNDSLSAYKIGNHRHTPEINEKLSLFAKQPVSITFTPHLLPLTRGMMSTIYTCANESVKEPDIRKVYDQYYSECAFVRVLGKNQYPAISHVKGTNCCDFGFHVDEQTGRIIIVSVIDNLLKGAAGQAVQNMNLMFGYDETDGLDYVQSPL